VSATQPGPYRRQMSSEGHYRTATEVQGVKSPLAMGAITIPLELHLPSQTTDGHIDGNQSPYVYTGKMHLLQ
jgi:hypothetical protein